MVVASTTTVCYCIGDSSISYCYPCYITGIWTTVATDVVLLLQVPPDTLLLNMMVDPTHTEEAPLIVPALGTGFTVMVADAVVDPQIFVTV